MVLIKFTEQDMLRYKEVYFAGLKNIFQSLKCPSISVSVVLLDTERHIYIGQNTEQRPENKQMYVYLISLFFH